jgi:glycosyltransferase involved in cell wall biosynthesis
MFGGIERMLSTLAATASRELNQHFAVSPANRLAMELRQVGVEPVPLFAARASRPLSVLRARRHFKKTLSNLSPDATVFHGSWTHAMFAPVARAHGSVVAFWQHAPITQPHWPDRWALGTVPDVAIFNSRFTAGTPVFPCVPGHVIYCPVSETASITAEQRAAGRRALGAGDDQVVVLMAARLEAWKGQTALIEAARLLRGSNVKVLIAGGVQRPEERPFFEQLGAQIEQAGLAASVSLLGQRTDVPALMRLADIYCQPNLAPEPFGIAVAEAMRAGLPCIVSNTGGAAELVDGSCGVLTAPGDVAAVAAAIKTLAESPDRRAAFGSAAASRAARLTDPEGRLTELATALDVKSQPSSAAMPVQNALNGTGHRLVCVTTSAALGGAETSLLTLLDALRAIEPAWQVTVVAPADGPLLDKCRSAGISTVTVPYPAAMASLGEPGVASTGSARAGRVRSTLRLVSTAAVLLPYLRRLRGELRRRNPTIVHTNGIKAHVAASLTSPRGARLVWHLHEYVRARPSTAQLLRRLARRPAAIVVNSDSVADDVRAAFGNGHVLRRVHNAVDLTVFRPEGPAFDLAGAAGLPPDQGLVRIGLVATFGRWKGHDVFLEAVARIAAEHPVRAYIVGGAVYQTSGSQCSLDELKVRVSTLGLQDVVGFTGHITDVPAALRALDIVVHASTNPEPFGMVIAEAMAAGRAVVAVEAGGSSELFQDGVDALGHRMGDAEDLARQLRRLVQDPPLRERLGRAARVAAERRFSAARMAMEFRQVYVG